MFISQASVNSNPILYIGETIGFRYSSCSTIWPHFLMKFLVDLSFCANHSSVSLFFIKTSPFGFLLAPSANLLPRQVIWYTQPSSVCTTLKCSTIFSGPSGCSGGSILVADTTTPGLMCFNTSVSISGKAYISAWYIITISFVAILTNVSYSIVCPNLSGPLFLYILTFWSFFDIFCIHFQVPSSEKSSAIQISCLYPRFFLIDS